MASEDPSKGVLMNLRVIDQDAAAELTGQLQALLDRSSSSMASLAQLLDQVHRGLTGGWQIAKRLEEQLQSGVTLQASLEKQLIQSESLVASMDSRRNELDAASTRLSTQVAESTRRLETLASQTQSRLEALATESTQRVEHEFMPAFDRAQVMAELIRNAEAALAVNALHAALDGGVRAAPVAVAAMPSAAGQPAAMADLRQRVDDLTNKYSEQQRAHQISSESQTALLSGVSQELHREIAQLMASAEALRATSLDRRQMEYLNDASASVAALLEMIRGISDLSFDQPQQPKRVDGPFDLRMEIQSMSGLLAKRARDGGRTLTCQIEDDVPGMVRGDCGRLRQALLYMVNGAFKLAGPGEIVMRTHVEHAVDTYSSVRVTISHQGKGIPADQLNHLFNALPPVSDVGGTAASTAPSPSLGLAVAEQLVQRMGGSVGVEADDPNCFALWFRVPWPKPLISADNGRVFNRVVVDSVLCNLGAVIDLSLGGARIRCAKEHTGTVDLVITDEERTITVSSEVTWCNHLGWRKYELGLRFLNLTPAIAEQLTRLTMQNRIRRVMGTED